MRKEHYMTYVSDLESAVEKALEKNKTLEAEKEQLSNQFKNRQDYLKNVIYYLAKEMDEYNIDLFEKLQEISKLEKKKVNLDNSHAKLIFDYVAQKVA